MSEVKCKNIKMLKDDRGAPEGHTVVDYPKDFTGPVRLDLADAFITSGSAEELPDLNAPVVLLGSWPPSGEEIAKLSFSALGVLLEGKGVALGPLKSEGLRREALLDLIEAEAPPPWPAGNDEGKIPDKALARQLKAQGVDLSTITTRDAAEAKLRELMGMDGQLRDDGPTLTEFVAAGYSALGYPPEGYAAKPLNDEEKAVVEKATAEKAAAESAPQQKDATDQAQQ